MKYDTTILQTKTVANIMQLIDELIIGKTLKMAEKNLSTLRSQYDRALILSTAMGETPEWLYNPRNVKGKKDE
jgi:hypothetical protein